MPKTRSQRSPALKVIDIFAGPGGLGEGFAAFETRGARPFEVQLSVEKDPIACATLELRKLFRQFDSAPAEFSAYYAGELSRAALFATFPVQARRAKAATWKAELGKVPRRQVSARVKKALGTAREWVLLGGPPCQAYSVAGRSRMRGQAGFEKDERHFLYREYLQIVADHEPALFVLENVKGLLSSTHGGSRIVTRILDDLSGPAEAIGSGRRGGKRYRLYSLCQRQVVLPWVNGSVDGSEFLVQSEEYGIPQMRHRIFIVGVRSDIPGNLGALKPQPEVATASVLSDLPRIRSTLSREDDNSEAWRAAIAMIRKQRWLRGSVRADLRPVVDEIERVLEKLTSSGPLTTGAAFADYSGGPQALRDWYRQGASGIAQHESRKHMKEDLHRYLFCACFAKVHRRSPRLGDFPEELQPSHRNVSLALETQFFADRFRVQLPNRPSTTITSHVSKDGHYYIHYDPVQCRSLTVREAARLQTFPDSYFFEGNRTQQYHQIGNAVPPLLAREIAQVVFELLSAQR